MYLRHIGRSSRLHFASTKGYPRIATLLPVRRRFEGYKSDSQKVSSSKLQMDETQRCGKLPPNSNVYSVPKLFEYTRGRWLIDDAEELRARFLAFNYENLCALVLANCPGSTYITALEKREGSNTRVLIFSTDNGKKLVARLPTSVAGPKRLVTNSEVATIEFGMPKASGMTRWY